MAFVVALPFVLPQSARAQAVYIVTDVTNIAGQDGICDAVCTLDEAIIAANGHANVNGVPDRIEFHVGIVPATYVPGPTLTPITDPVVIDGTTQPGYAGIPLITVDGNANADDLFVLTGGATTIQGLAIVDGLSVGISISVAGGNTIRNCVITGHGDDGIAIVDSPDNIIGGGSITDRNIIGGNTEDGVEITGSQSRDNIVKGNYIGLSADGAGNSANGFQGVLISSGATGNTIGGVNAEEGNIISWNTQYGIQIITAHDNVIQGNLIGLAADGSTASPNGLNGVNIDGGAFGNLIGGTVSGAGNVISGNLGSGIEIDFAHLTTVQGNYIGTDNTGTSSVGNVGGGILIRPGSTQNAIGGAASGARNLVSGNDMFGIQIESASDNVVAGNYIGTDASGQLPLPNASVGVALVDASNNTIGGLSAGEGNLISANLIGVLIDADTAPAEDNLVQGNLIGTNSNGVVSAGMGNSSQGVLIDNTSANPARRNIIGGTASGAGNVIAGNGADGIDIRESVDSDAVDNPILGNSIFQNVDQGIDLAADNVTPNDNDDVDSGPNQEQNFPILGLATSNGTTTVSGTLNSRSNTSYRIEFFSVTTPDTPSGNGEGEVYLGFHQIETDNFGDATFSASLSASLPAGTYVTSTATELDVDDTTPLRTSEFSSATIVGSSIIVVNTTANTDDGTCEAFVAGPPDHNCTLHEAIDLANMTVGIIDVITFDIAGTGPHTIDVSSGASTLPTVSDPVVIDGTTEPDFAGTPVIYLYGNSSIANGLTITAGNSTIRGLAIADFLADGIALNDNGGNVVESSYIGLNPGGTPVGNGVRGIHLDSDGNRIGGTSADTRNVISANMTAILVSGSENVVQNNYIGTNVNGDGAAGNSAFGIEVTSAENIITDNVISGNGGDGIILNTSSSADNIFTGNLIGTSADGAGDLGNGSSGIILSNAGSNNTIGGTAPGDRNVISGNGIYGVVLNGATITGTLLQGNYIGVSADGVTDLGNGNNGIQINNGASSNTVGGSAAGAGNVISGNGQAGSGSGILISDGADGNLVLGNRIGTDAAGTEAIPNADHGVAVTIGADDNIVGGSSSAAGNLIAGNGGHGVWIAADAGASPIGTILRGNWIGTQADGSSPLGNTGHGVLIDDGDQSFVGGTTSGAGNTIAYNGLDGVAVINGGHDNAIQRNAVFSNGGHSIDLGNNGVTFNDFNDVDAGPNELQNYPLLTQATSNGSTTSVLGSLNSEASSNYRIEFFSTATLGPGDKREARTYLGAVNVTTSASNTASIVALLPANVADGHFVVTTATDLSDNQTSELSSPIQATNTGAVAVTQDCTLGPGWDWFSINVDPADTDIDDVLAGVSAALNDIIKNPNTGAFSVWDGGSWVGPLTSVTAGNGYKIKLADQGMISVTGPATTADFSAVAGWNSIGFLRQTSEATGTYLSSLALLQDDLIKSDDGTFSVYTGATWVGSLNTLAPCEGYMLKVQNAGTLSKTEPTGGAISQGSLTAPEWHVNPAEFEHSMNIIGVLEIEGRASIEASDLVGAFSGGELRGFASPIDVDGEMMFFLTVFGRTGDETIRFRAYDSVADAVKESDATISFEIDGVQGSTRDPFAWRAVISTAASEDAALPVTFALDQNYPNPFNPVTRIEYALAEPADVMLDVFDLHGRKVHTLVAARQNAGRYGVEWNGRGSGGEQMASGMYFYRLTAGEFVQTRKLMLVK